MKVRIILSLFVFLTFASVNSFAQEITLTTTSANVISNKAVIDIPELNNNPSAVIVATPIGNTASLNPHPVGAWYYNNKWNIFNTDAAVMPLGAKYLVQYFPQPDSSHFVHIIPQGSGGSSATVSRTHLDYAWLDNQPNAKFKIFQNHAPSNRAFFLNPNEAQALYENGRWYIQNVNGVALHPNTAYNVVIESGATVGTPIPIDKSGGKTKFQPPINENAGGDLYGNYPNPTVIGLQGNPISKSKPSIGDTLRWNGTAWEPAKETAATPTTTAPPTPVAATVQVFFKTPNNLTAGLTNADRELSDNKNLLKLTNISHSIVLTKKSRLVISGCINSSGPYQFPGSTAGLGTFFIKINNAEAINSRIGILAPYVGMVFNYLPSSISNYVIELNPGTYNIEFFARHENGTAIFYSWEQFSSVLVIPVE